VSKPIADKIKAVPVLAGTNFVNVHDGGINDPAAYTLPKLA